MVEECAYGAMRSYGSALVFFSLGKTVDRPNLLSRDQVDDLALEAADDVAARAAASGQSVPTVTAIAVDRRTGQVYAGASGSFDDLGQTGDELAARLGRVEQREAWAVANCGEVAACHAALADDADFDDLRFYAVYTDTGRYRELCSNCIQWAEAIFPELKRGQ